MFTRFFTINVALDQVLYQSPDALKIVDFLWISLVKTPYLNDLHHGIKCHKTIAEDGVGALPQGLLMLHYE